MLMLEVTKQLLTPARTPTRTPTHTLTRVLTRTRTSTLTQVTDQLHLTPYVAVAAIVSVMSASIITNHGLYHQVTRTLTPYPLALTLALAPALALALALAPALALTSAASRCASAARSSWAAMAADRFSVYDERESTDAVRSWAVSFWSRASAPTAEPTC